MTAPSVSTTITPIMARAGDTLTANNVPTAPTYPGVISCVLSTANTPNNVLTSGGRAALLDGAGSYVSPRTEGAGWAVTLNASGGGFIFGHISYVDGSSLASFDTYPNSGITLAIRSGVGNWRRYKIAGSDFWSTTNYRALYNHFTINRYYPFVIQPTVAGDFTDDGTFNPASIDRIEIHFSRITSAQPRILVDECFFCSSLSLINGEIGNPASLNTIANYFNPITGTVPCLLFLSQGTNQYYNYSPFITIDSAYYQDSYSCELIDDVPSAKLDITNRSVNLNAASGSTFILSNTTLFSNAGFNVTTNLNTGATRNLTSIAVQGSGNNTLNSGWSQIGGSFVVRDQITMNSATLSGVVVQGSTNTNGTVVLSTTGGIVESRITGNSVGIRINSAGDYTNNSPILVDNSVRDILIASGTTGGSTVDINISTFVFPSGSTTPTQKIRVDDTAGTINLISPAGITSSNISSAGATVNVIAPSSAVTIALNVNTRLKIYNTGTTTLVDGINDSSTSFSFESGVIGQGYDIYVVKPGLIPRVLRNYIFPASSANIDLTMDEDLNFIEGTWASYDLTLDGTGLGTTTDISINPTTQLITMATGNNLSQPTGISFQDLYSFVIEARFRNDELMPFHSPIVALSATAGEFELRRGWDFGNQATKNLIRDGGYALWNSAGTTVLEQWINITGLGAIDAAEVPYYRQVDSTNTTITTAINPGLPNQLVQIFGGPSNGDFDYTNHFTLFLRARGRTFDRYDLRLEQNLPTLRAQRYFLPLSTIEDPNIGVSDATIAADAPYTGMSITFFGTDQEREVNGTPYQFRTIVDGNGGSAQQIREFLHWSMRLATDIDGGAGIVLGQISPRLYETTILDKLALGRGVWVDNFLGADQLAIIPVDVNGQQRPFPPPPNQIVISGIPEVTGAILAVINLTTEAISYPVLSGGGATIELDPGTNYLFAADAPGYLRQAVTLPGNTPTFNFSLEDFRALYESGINRSSDISFNYSTLVVTISDGTPNLSFADVFRTLEDYLATESGVLFPNPPIPVVVDVGGGNGRNYLFFPYDSINAVVNPVVIKPDPTNTIDPTLTNFVIVLEGSTAPLFDIFDFTEGGGRTIRFQTEAVSALVNVSGGLSTEDRAVIDAIASDTDDLAATLDSAGVFSEASLVNAPSSGGNTVDSYLDAIWIDTVNGAAGTTVGTHGLPTNPVNSFADALTISNALNIRNFKVFSGSIISTGTLSNYTFSCPNAFSDFSYEIRLTGNLTFCQVNDARVVPAANGVVIDSSSLKSCSFALGFIDSTLYQNLELFGSQAISCQFTQNLNLTITAEYFKNCTFGSSCILIASGQISRLEECYGAINLRSLATGIALRIFNGTGTVTRNGSSTATASVSVSGGSWTVGTGITFLETVPTLTTRLAASAYLAPANSDITAIKAKTDQLAFTIAGQVNANTLTGGGDDAETIYNYFTTSDREDLFKATGFATPSNISDAQTAIITQGNSAWVTANVSNLLTTSAFNTAIDELETYGDNNWATATGFLTTLGTNAPDNWINSDVISTDAVTKIQSGLSTFDGDLSSVTNAIAAIPTNPLLANDARVDNLDAAISSRSTYSGADTSGTTMLLSRLSGDRATYLDKLNVSGTLANTDNASAFMADLTSLSAAIALIPTNPLLSTEYVAPDNDGIANIPNLLSNLQSHGDSNWISDLTAIESNISTLLDKNMLTIGKPVTHSPTQIVVGSNEMVINLAIDEDNNTVTGTRTT